MGRSLLSRWRLENTFLLVKMLLEVSKAAKNGRLGGAAVTAKVRTLNPLSLELLCASWRLQLGGKHVSPRENAFGDLQSCQNGRLGGAAVTAEVRTLNPLSLEPLCAAWRLQLGGKHVSPRENAFGGLQSCQNGRLGGAAVTAKVRTLNPLSLGFCVPLGGCN